MKDWWFKAVANNLISAIYIYMLSLLFLLVQKQHFGSGKTNQWTVRWFNAVANYLISAGYIYMLLEEECCVYLV